MAANNFHEEHPQQLSTDFSGSKGTEFANQQSTNTRVGLCMFGNDDSNSHGVIPCGGTLRNYPNTVIVQLRDPSTAFVSRIRPQQLDRLNLFDPPPTNEEKKSILRTWKEYFACNANDKPLPPGTLGGRGKAYRLHDVPAVLNPIAQDGHLDVVILAPNHGWEAEKGGIVVPVIQNVAYLDFVMFLAQERFVDAVEVGRLPLTDIKACLLNLYHLMGGTEEFK